MTRLLVVVVGFLDDQWAFEVALTHQVQLAYAYLEACQNVFLLLSDCLLRHAEVLKLTHSQIYPF